eukprot:04761.XXX_56324_55355_1 [CDS] Oithona nana genome sequencing.
MKTFYIFLVFFIQANFGFEQDLEDDETDDIIDTDSIIATDHQLVLRSTDGKIKMGTDSGSHYRAEIKDANNEAKGIYSWIDPLGNAHTTAFNAGQNGYQVLPVPKSGLVLPPFPYGLYRPRPQEAQARIKIESKPEPPFYKPSSPSTYQDDDDVVVIGPDPEEPQSESPFGDDLLGGFQIQPGTPVAASRPTATAVAGEKGTAQVQPQSQASVGPGGVAIAFPTASAGVGPGGVAVARPVAVSSAGDGGIAIAGGTSTAFAGLDGSSTQQVLFNNQAVLPQN